MAPHGLGPGARVGPYRIVSELGRGGMGVVFEAEDERIGRRVALKVVSSDLAGRGTLAERFAREARAAAAVTHEGIATVLDVGESEGRSFVVLELLRGGSLRDLVRKRGALPWRDACRLGARIAGALAAVHAAGLVHRDLKPANVLLTEDGRPKLTDFGLVRWADASQRRLTKTGELLGTPEYLAPELASSGTVDARADLYAFGATLHELVAGQPPFRGSAFELVKKHLADAPPPLRSLVPDVPAELEALVLRLLEKEPDARGSGAAEVAPELLALAEGREKTRASRGAFVGVGLAFVLAVAGALGIGLALGRGREPAPSASPAPTARPAPSPSPCPTPSPVRFWSESRLAAETWANFPQTPHTSVVRTLGARVGRGELGFTRLALAPGGAHVLTVGADGLARFSLATGAFVDGVACPDGARVPSLFSLDDRLLAAGPGGELALFRVGAGLEAKGSVSLERGPVKPLRAIAALSPDRLVVASEDTLYFLSAKTLAAARPRVTLAPGGIVTDLAVSDDGQKLLVVRADRVEVFEVATWSGRVLVELPVQDGWTAYCGRFYPGTSLAVVGTDQNWQRGYASPRLQLLDGSGVVETAALPGHPAALVAVGDAVAVALRSGQLGLYRRDRPVELVELGDRAPCTALARGPGSTVLVGRGNDVGPAFAVDVVDVATGKVVAGHTGHASPVLEVVPFRRERHALSASVDGTVRRWDLETGTEVHRYSRHAGPVGALALSPEENHVLTGGSDGELVLWRTSGGVIGSKPGAHALGTQGKGIVHAVFSPDGRLAATTDWAHHAKLWSIPDLRLVGDLVHELEMVHGVAFTANGKRLVTASGNGGDQGRISIWDVATGNRIKQVSLSVPQQVHGLALLRDPERALVTVTDGLAYVWDNQGDPVPLAPWPNDGGAASLHVSPDEKWAISVAETRAVLFQIDGLQITGVDSLELARFGARSYVGAFGEKDLVLGTHTGRLVQLALK